MPTQKPRYTVIVDEELLKEIDDFRFENRYPSRSAATLELIRLGIEQLKKERPLVRRKRLPSSENGTFCSVYITMIPARPTLPHLHSRWGSFHTTAKHPLEECLPEGVAHFYIRGSALQ